MQDNDTKTEAPVETIELDLQGAARTIHEMIEMVADDSMLGALRLSVMGITKSELIGVISFWDQLTQATPEEEIDAGTASPEESMSKIHSQVDSILNGDAVVTIKPLVKAPAETPEPSPGS